MASNEDIARRWMGSKHWGGWRVGMLMFRESCSYTRAVCVVASDDYIEFAGYTYPPDDLAPEPDHPGTRAFLLEDVRRAYEDPFAQIVSERDQGRPVTGWGHRVQGADADWLGPWCDTEAEALVSALEAAP